MLVILLVSAPNKVFVVDWKVVCTGNDSRGNGWERVNRRNMSKIKRICAAFAFVHRRLVNQIIFGVEICKWHGSQPKNWKKKLPPKSEDRRPAAAGAEILLHSIQSIPIHPPSLSLSHLSNFKELTVHL